jgi:polysaccharide biosynthesis transport protein
MPMNENGEQLSQSIIRAQNAAPLPAPQFPIYNAVEEAGQINLLDYWRVLVKRRWTILAFAFAVVTLTAIATWKAIPTYRSTIRLQIDPENQNILPFKDSQEIGSTYAQSQEYLQTQFKVLESKTLAERVIRVLNLDTNPAFMQTAEPSEKSKTMEGIRNIFGLGDQDKDGKNADPSIVEERKLANSIRLFVSNLSTSPIRNSRLVDVNYEARDPKLAADVANALAEQYIRMNFETKFQSTTSAAKFLDEQITDLKAKVEKAEEELVRFSREHDIYEISDKENVILQKLADLNKALTAAQAERIHKESVWKTVLLAAPGNFPDILHNDIIKEIEKNLATLKVQQSKLEALFRPGWPELDQVTGQVAESEAQLAAERKKAIANSETEYLTSVQHEKLLSDALAAQKVEADNFYQNSIQYKILKRQVDTGKQLYDGLLQRMEEAGVSAGLHSNNIHVVDPAKPQRVPYRPNKTMNVMLALAVGLMLGIGLAFFIEHLDSSIKTPDDMDRFLKLPSLGVIPSMASLAVPSHRKRLAASAGGNGSKGSGSAQAVELISFQDGKSLMSEAYRNLRTSVLLSSGSGQPPKSLVVTSSQPKEGKTTTALNLAIILAQTGGKVILLDCDMRNPRVHRVFNLENEGGMSSFLSGNSDLPSLIQQTNIPNLYAITAGQVPPNPAELLGSPRMKQCLMLLNESYQHIVIDSPPVLSVTDARILGTIADGVILVVKGGHTPKEAVKRTKQLLQEVHAHLIGALLNNINVRSADYYYYAKYYYGYGKKYGYGYGVKNEKEEPHESA